MHGILDLVVREFRLADAGEEWKQSIRQSAISAHAVLMRHPWACALMMSPGAVSAARLGYMEALLGRLREAGFSAETTDHAYHALDSHIIGFTLWHTGYSTALKADPDLLAGSYEQLLASYPYLTEHAQQHERKRRPGEPSDYEFGLDLIVEGLQGMLGTD